MREHYAGELAAPAAEAIDRIDLASAPCAPSFRVPGGTVPPALQPD